MVVQLIWQPIYLVNGQSNTFINNISDVCSLSLPISIRSTNRTDPIVVTVPNGVHARTDFVLFLFMFWYTCALVLSGHSRNKKKLDIETCLTISSLCVWKLAQKLKMSYPGARFIGLGFGRGITASFVNYITCFKKKFKCYARNKVTGAWLLLKVVQQIVIPLFLSLTFSSFSAPFWFCSRTTRLDTGTKWSSLI